MPHAKWLEHTVRMATNNVQDGGGPYAAIVVKNDEIIGSGTNLVHILNDPSAHAELLAIREACAILSTTDLSDCIIYASGEPCPMCLGASYWANIGSIYYASTSADALTEGKTDSPLSNFFSDQNKNAENRIVPSFYLSTQNALEPFRQWKKKNQN